MLHVFWIYALLDDWKADVLQMLFGVREMIMSPTSDEIRNRLIEDKPGWKNVHIYIELTIFDLGFPWLCGKLLMTSTTVKTSADATVFMALKTSSVQLAFSINFFTKRALHHPQFLPYSSHNKTRNNKRCLAGICLSLFWNTSTIANFQ